VKILFVSHSAGRTGAPALLLHLGRWLREDAGAQCAFVVRAAGARLDEFQALGPTSVLPTGALTGRLLGKGRLGRRVLRPYVVPLARQLGGVDLIYSNTITNGRVLGDLSAVFRRPVISHIHELALGTRLFTQEPDLRKLDDATDRYIACSRAVSTFLQEQQRIRPERISVVHEFIPARLVSRCSHGPGIALRRSLGLSDKAVVVGGVGTTDYRKAPDIFVEVARRLRSARSGTDVRFVWVGGSGAGLEELRGDVRRAGLSEHVHVVGERTDTPACFGAFDVFLLSSREDAYPLAMLETAALGKPTVCFRGNGGAPEFVEEDAGICVPSGDVKALTGAVSTLVDDEDRRRALGAAAREKVLDRHDVSRGAPKVLSIIRSELERWRA
jgi:glycosyltransferase involved in cell wall biosynthesis